MIYSIGHSNHELTRFVELLHQHEIAVLADVRTSPYSKYSPHFNRDDLRHALRAARIEYLFLGPELGGRPAEEQFYDGDGHVRYDLLAESESFRRGLAQLEAEAKERRVAMMCSEENPAVCHRFLMVARVLEGRGIRVTHIRGDGSVQGHETVMREAVSSKRDANQLMLFDAQPELPWRSLQSVLQKRPQPSFSEFSETPESDD